MVVQFATGMVAYDAGPEIVQVCFCLECHVKHGISGPWH